MLVIILYFSGFACIMSGLAEIHKKQFDDEGTGGGWLGLLFDVFFWKYFLTHWRELKMPIFQFVMGCILVLLALFLNRDAQVLVP